ncbi:MAG: NFACT family protein [Lachnospiraceae bacterium]|nr:NFACT family protein [Lachnospiraceae bacterium]
MAFDGITVAALAAELSHKLTGARISKIAQPEGDELLFTLKNYKENYRLTISANASLPLVYLTEENKMSPMTAPNFCMLLRKHIGNGRILSITQPGLERILDIAVEHLDELGDLKEKHLMIELMGKHSNIIFCNESGQIVDAIKRIPPQVSSVREVLPGRPYFIPDTMHKLDPKTVTEDEFCSQVLTKGTSLAKALYTGLTGLSPIAAEEIVYRAGLDSDVSAPSLSVVEQVHLWNTFTRIMEEIKSGHFSPAIYYRNGEPSEFSVLPLTCLGVCESTPQESVSAMLSSFYAEKDTLSRIRQKSADMRHVINTALERNRKKYDLQLKQLSDTDKRDKYRIYGELINTYGYQVEPGSSSFKALNYYTGEEITIPLDKDLSISANAKKYFERYNKLKRTFEALTDLCAETKAEIDYLESVSNALDIAAGEEDLTQLKDELRESGYAKKRSPKDKQARIISKPFHYLTEDGFHLYVGKNNLQNEDLTFRLATGNDWWFHAKGIPGSHVIVKTEGRELPDRVFEQAAAVAAWYSKAKGNEKVEVDYVEKKHVKKVAGAKPGFVIYHTNYSMVVKPGLEGCTAVN